MLSSLDSQATLPLCAAVAVALIYGLFFRRTKLDHIPTLGYSSPLLSYLSAYKFRTQSKKLVEEGYKKFPGQVWKLATFDRWYVIANGLERVHEMGRAPEEYLSGIINFEGYLQLDHTLGPEVTTNPYHIPVVRTYMTRNIAAQFADMRDEAIAAFEEVIPRSATGWVAVPIFSAVTEVLSRISARLAVGAPLCENEHFRFLCGHSGDVIMRGRRLRFFPKFLKPLASKYLVDIEGDLRPLAQYLEPLINERLQQQRQYGKRQWEDKPNDTLMWLIEECQKSGTAVTPYDMATRLYFLTFASDGIATMLHCALYEICTRPEYVQPLRDEVQEVVATEGWTKDALANMHKLDSFFREVHRVYDLNLLHLGRKVMRDFSFSDGTLVPAGTTIFVNSYGAHYDPANYPAPAEFNGFRFVVDEHRNGAHAESANGNGAQEKYRPKQEDSQTQHLLVKPTLNYQPFGYGRLACPGRFTAASQMKLMLAYLLATYDIQTDTNKSPLGFSEKQFSPNMGAKVYFRRRDTVKQ